MSQWRRVEVYTTFLKLSGDLEGPADERLSDLVTAPGPVLELRDAVVEPFAEPHLQRGRVPMLSVMKSAISLVCPRDQVAETARLRDAWREKNRVSVQLTAQAFSMLCEVHLEPGVGLEDHLCGSGGQLVPVTNFSALWQAGGAEPRAVQRGFALVNCAWLVSFAPAPPR